MPEKKTVRRVAALSFVGAAVALYAAQAGSLPGFGVGSGQNIPTAMSSAPLPPGAETPAALAALPTEVVSVSASSAHVSDRFVPAQANELPAGSGFGAPPRIEYPIHAAATFPEAASIRPAAFNPASSLETPRAPLTGPEPAPAQALSPLGLPCGLDLTTDAAPHATVALGVVAPCHPGARVTIRHSGLTIVAETDAVGLLALDIPAFENPAFVSVELADGTTDDALLPVPDLGNYDRVALVGDGTGLELHAMEGDAGWQSPGHLHPDAPRTAMAAADGLGYLSMLGTAGGIVQIYTLPRSGPVAAAGVSFSVDAPVTTSNCTRAVDAGLLRMQAGGRVDVTPLSLTFPGCDAVGDTLVLQNALGGLRLAAN